jgi:exopolysaccharide biosynthesis polyprenyl glycosylphosphotransferase
MKTSIRLRQYVLLIVDLIMLFAALFATLWLRRGLGEAAATYGVHVRYFVLIFAVWLIIYYVAGFYDLQSDFDQPRFFGKVLWTSFLGTLIGAVYFYLDTSAPIGPKTVMLLDGLITTAFIWIWRSSYSRVSRGRMPKRKVAFVGSNKALADIVAELRAHPGHGYEAAAFYDESGGPAPAGGMRELRDAESLIWMARGLEISLVVIADERALSEQTRMALISLMSPEMIFMRLDAFYEYLLRKIPIGTISDFWFLENIDLRAKKPYEVAKRVTDILLATLGLVAFLPIWLIVAVAVKLSSKGGVFFTQTRLGKGERHFKIVKFRTMRSDGNDFSPTGHNDSRITPIGNFLRRTRIDEVPQFINILRGEMSFIGPRPERPELAEGLERTVPYYRQRLLVKPGITGWDQVSGEYHSPSVEDTYKKLQFDLYYIKNLSLFLDISILAKTIATVFARSGR